MDDDLKMIRFLLSRALSMVEALEKKEAPLSPVKRSSWISPARVEVLKRLYPSGSSMRDIVKALEKLPGGPLPSSPAIRSYSSNCLHLKRQTPLLSPNLVAACAAKARNAAARRAPRDPLAAYATRVGNTQ